MFERLGIRSRLLLAFFGIGFLALVAAAAAVYALVQVGDVVDRITQHRVPAALASLELSRQAERVAAAAPALLAATTKAKHDDVSSKIRAEMAQLDGLLSALQGTALGTGIVEEIEGSVVGLRRNLEALDEVVAARLAVVTRKDGLLRRFAETTTASQRLVSAGLLVMSSRVAEWRRAASDPAAGPSTTVPGTADLMEAIAESAPQQRAQFEISAINDTLLKASVAPTPADLSVISFPLHRSIEALEALMPDIAEKLQARLRQRLEEFKALVDGPKSLVAARAEELTVLAEGEKVVAQNQLLSRLLTGAVDRLVSGANSDIADAGRDAATAQRYGTAGAFGAVLLSLMSSVAIVLLYVDRNLLARLAQLSQSMLAIAGGDLRAPLPGIGRDEIGRLAEALRLFRDTALEVEEKNLREVAEARQRLIDAIESISEGFALYDAGDRLVLCNNRYRDMLYPGIADSVSPGTQFEAIIRNAVRQGLVEDAKGREEEWIAARLAAHRELNTTLVQHRAGGRWIQVNERRITGGGTVAVYSDISELKQREANLAEKSTALETLSSKLAKYLAPQVYNSIFAGRQDVRIASQRKKLTVCFSDIAGFSETTDKLESEELTQLLNLYLTEMSRIALAHGATIDKYVGDAMVMFFGDPETRGIKEDALACVKMAIAMQKRIRELAVDRRNAGIEMPLRCRIGIHTGFCTVGNFGSEDRMDYTIIGGAVNLASRLEHEAVPANVLISYETFAHVKDEIECEEQGQIHVKGIAYPITTYRVVDLKADLASPWCAIRAELAHLKLDVEPELMSDEERSKASATLRAALNELASRAGKSD